MISGSREAIVLRTVLDRSDLSLVPVSAALSESIFHDMNRIWFPPVNISHTAIIIARQILTVNNVKSGRFGKRKVEILPSKE
jgi:hypothetical protein